MLGKKASPIPEILPFPPFLSPPSRRDAADGLVSQVMLQQRVLQQDQQLRDVQEENELQRQKLQEEVAGYREQSKQHSLTILALEDRLLEATQQQKVLEEEKAALVEKMEGK